MSVRSVEYLIQEAFTGIRRNGLMAVASITTIALSLGVLGAFVLMVLGANNFAQAQLGEFEIAVFLNVDADQADADAVLKKIQGIKGVRSVVARSRDKEWATFKRQHPDIESAGLPINPLPHALDVKVADPARTAAVAASIRGIPQVDTVKEGREALDRVMAIAQVVKVVSIIGVAVLFVTTVFIISNAIKLTLYARRREIRIMQLVGATNWFIRIPLVMEGVIFGAVGAFAAWILLQIGGGYVGHVARRITPLLAQFTSGFEPAQLAVVMVILGSVIGAAGSFVSIRRFLHDEAAMGSA